MPQFVPAQLHPLLGRELSHIDESRIARLIGSAETEWFDAKSAPYGAQDSQRRDLASDVAAFANRGGGLIVIGLEEDTAGLIRALTPVDSEVLSNEEVRVAQVVSGLVSPVPVFHTIRVASESSPGRSYLLVAVPPSLRRPHCVAVGGESLRFPMREGSHKRYLAESEIADLYRSRFQDAVADVSDAHARHVASIEELCAPDAAWLTVSLRPDRPGHVSVTRDALASLRGFGTTSPPFPTIFGSSSLVNAMPSFRSVTIRDGFESIDSLWARLHVDGAGTIAYAWRPEPARGMVMRENEETRAAWISDEDLVGCLVNSVWALSVWAIRDASAGGDAILEVDLRPPGSHPATLWQYRGSFPSRLPGARDLLSIAGPVTMTVAPEAILSSPKDLLVVVRRLTQELEGAFGVLGPPQIDAEGSLRIKYFYGDRHRLVRAWAEAHGVEVSESAQE